MTSKCIPISLPTSSFSLVYMAAQDNSMYVSLNSGASWNRIQTETYLSLPFVKAVSSLDGSYGLGRCSVWCMVFGVW
ncbi:hypothetical protein EON63_16055 [archaeon]|nr:MAG: hypothetical protein EON63_16055 [archaeon]